MRRAFAIVVLTLVAGCHGGARTPAGPAVDYVVTEPAAAFDQVQAGAITLSPPAVSGLAPLAAARTFPAPGDPAEYGLDHPQLTLSYVRAGTVAISVDIGAANFDGHGYYAHRAGDSRVFLVLRDALLATFREVGITPVPMR